MPKIKVSPLEVSQEALDQIQEKLGLSAYDVIDDLEYTIRQRFSEIREDAKQ